MSQTSGGGVWKDPAQSKNFLQGTRAAIPLALEQLDMIGRVAGMAVSKPERILDLGCGGGELGLYLLERYPEAFCLFTDFSETMLDAAQERIRQAGAKGEAMKLDFSAPEWVEYARPHGPFDIILSGFAIHHQSRERKIGVYGEVYSLLRPDGLFLNLENVSSPTEKLSRFFEKTFVDALVKSREAKGLPADREKLFREWKPRRDEDLIMTSSMEEQLSWLVDIGFSNVDCYFKYLEFALFGGQKPGGAAE